MRRGGRFHTSSSDPYQLPTRRLRDQLKSFSADVREAARVHHAAAEGTKLLHQQTFQCQFIGRLDSLLRDDAETGTFRAAGGQESGVYETFFRVCPGRFMTRSQFIYVRGIVVPSAVTVS